MSSRSPESSGLDQKPTEEPKPRLIKKEDSTPSQELPHFVSMEELEAIYDTELTPDERSRITGLVRLLIQSDLGPKPLEEIEELQRLGEIKDRLMSRSGEKMLPVSDEDRKSFIFRRANQIEKADKQHHINLLSEGLTYEDMQDLAAFLLREKRKTDWLEENVYPEMFARAVIQAKGDVQQFLLKEVNNSDAMREQFADLDRIKVHFQDDIQFVLRLNNFPVPAGQYSEFHNTITVIVSPYFDMDDEQKIYQVLVHEYVHSISDRSEAHLALRGHDDVGLNEAMTEVIAYQIANEHQEQDKAFLNKRTNRKPNRFDSGYAHYIQRFEMILKKIPKRLFVDALLAPGGAHVLEEKFAEVFQGEITLASFTKFVEEEKTMRVAQEKRKRQKTDDDGVVDNVHDLFPKQDSK